MPIQVDGVLVRAISGAALSHVRTEFRLRLHEPINNGLLESRGRHHCATKRVLLCASTRIGRGFEGPEERVSAGTHVKTIMTHT